MQRPFSWIGSGPLRRRPGASAPCGRSRRPEKKPSDSALPKATPPPNTIASLCREGGATRRTRDRQKSLPRGGKKKKKRPPSLRRWSGPPRVKHATTEAADGGEAARPAGGVEARAAERFAEVTFGGHGKSAASIPQARRPTSSGAEFSTGRMFLSASTTGEKTPLLSRPAGRRTFYH